MPYFSGGCFGDIECIGKIATVASGEFNNRKNWRGSGHSPQRSLRQRDIERRFNKQQINSENDRRNDIEEHRVVLVRACKIARTAVNGDAYYLHRKIKSKQPIPRRPKASESTKFASAK